MWTLLILCAYSVYEACNAAITGQTICAAEGETIVLTCLVQATSTCSWDGPTDVLLANTKRYADGNMIDPNLFNAEKFSIVGDVNSGNYNLQIQNVTSDEEGEYRCYEINSTYTVPDQTKFSVKLEEPPSSIKVLNSTPNGIVHGLENESLVLLCMVNSVCSNETITWYEMSEKVETGGPGSLKLTIFPSRTHHQKEYSCEVNSISLTKPFIQVVTLDIKYKPYVTFGTSRQIKTVEGRRLSFPCSSDSNPYTSRIQVTKGTSILDDRRASTIQFSFDQISRHNRGLYTCEAVNSLGKGRSSIEIIVQYPPVISIKEMNLEKGVGKIRCMAHGEPQVYQFHSWEHISELGQHIRFLNNTEIITLHTYAKYKLNGVYICRADNGIADLFGNEVMMGNISVQTKHRPIFVSENQHKQHGSFGQDSQLVWNVYSYPEIDKEVNVNGQVFSVQGQMNITINQNIVIEEMYGVLVRLKGQEIVLKMSNLTESDFTTYDLRLENAFGVNNFTVILTAADKPEVPKQVRLTPGENDILVTWIRNFNGGRDQHFLVEYKTNEELRWLQEGPINDTLKTIMSHKLDGLKTDTHYMIRVFAVNSLGNGNKTDVLVVKTLATHFGHGLKLWIVAVACVSTITIISVTLAVIRFMRKGMQNKEDNSRTTMESWHEMQGVKYRPDVFSICMWYLKNSTPPLVEGGLAVENNLYESHEISLQSRRQNNGLDENIDLEDHATESARFIQKRGTQDAAVVEGEFQDCYASSLKGDDMLNYAEIVFSTDGAKGSIVIHGEENKTIYADVDHLAVADTMTDSDIIMSNDEDDDDDFMSLEGIIDYTNNRKML